VLLLVTHGHFSEEHVTHLLMLLDNKHHFLLAKGQRFQLTIQD